MATKGTAVAAPQTLPIDAVLKQLSARNQVLENIDLGISASVPKIEKLLRKCVSFQISVLTGLVDPENGWSECLVFSKVKGNWQLTVDDCDDDGNVRQRVPLSSCNRMLRARIFGDGHVEKLLRAAYEEIEAEIDKRKAAAAAIERLSVLAELVADDDDDVPAKEGGANDDLPF